MQFIIESIMRKQSNSLVHDAFIKFSKGRFSQKYLVQAKKGKEGWAINTNADYVNNIVEGALRLCSGTVDVTGVIVATFDVSAEAGFPIAGMKQFMGIKQAVVSGSVPVQKLLALIEKQPRAFYALSFSFPGGSVKTKAKAPKSAKPSTSREKEVAPDFCTLKTNDQSLVNHILLDVPEGKTITLSHDIVISDITIPSGVSDPVQLRERSIRMGTIERTCVVDENTTKQNYPFKA
jgi:hypothetical protein